MNRAMIAAAIGGAAWAQTPVRTVWDGLFSAEQAATGKALYDSKCASCHGAEMGGMEMASALAGAGFMGNWSGQSVGDLATRIKLTMPANDPGILSSRQTADITAYVLSFNKFPAGTAAMPSDAQILGQFAIVAEKPAGK